MKNFYVLLGLAFNVLLLASCGSSDVGFDMVKTARNCAPSFQVASSNSITLNTTDATYTALKGKFTYCGDSSEDYQDEKAVECGNANGVEINIGNIYKLLLQTQDYLNNYASNCKTQVSDSQTIKIEYDDGTTFIQSEPSQISCVNTEDESTQRHKGAVWRKGDDFFNFGVLYDHEDASDEALTYGSYDEKTHVFTLILALYTSGGGSYLKLEGNTEDHTFTFHDGRCFGRGRSSRFSDTITVDSIENDYIYVFCDTDDDNVLDKEYCLKASDASIVDLASNTDCQTYKDYLDEHDGSGNGDDDYIANPWDHGEDYTPRQHFKHTVSVQ